MPTREAFSLEFRIILLVIFLAAFVIATLLMAPRITQGWFTATLTAIGKVLVP